MPSEHHADGIGKPSKSQRKREARALFDLGRELVGLNRAALAKMPLDESLRQAVMEARAITAHVAHKRQLQYVAGLLRQRDAAPILAAVEALRAEGRQNAARHHRVEVWRDRLLQDGDGAVRDLLEQRPGIEAQALRQLLRNATREAERGQPPAAARKLFRFLRDIDTLEALPPA